MRLQRIEVDQAHQLASADLPHRRDGLFLALHRLVTALEAEGGVSVG